jgi:3-oxoacyl-[acyl-carrier-protein] synthase II
MTERRVAVTGMGVVTPIGIGVDAFWKGLLAGRSGVGPVDHFDASGLPARIAAYVRDGDALEAWRRRLGLEPTDPRSLLFALAAGRQAYEAAGWRDDLGGARAGAVFGSYGDKLDMGRMAEVAYRSRNDGAAEIPPSAFFERYCREFHGRQITRLLPHHATVRLARMYGALGPTCTIQTACTSSAQAIGEAFQMIRRGTVDRAICGGAECIVSPNHMLMFALLGVLSTRNEAPTRASRPFDSGRDGFVLGEGSAVLTLERLELARERGAPILCELVGYGTSCDAYRLTDEDPEGRGAIAAMTRAGRGSASAGRLGLHQRPRYLHPDERPGRDAGHQDAPGAARLPGARELHQIHARPHRVGRRGHRGRHLRPDAAGSGGASDHQPREPRPPVRSGLRAQHRQSRADGCGAVQLLRVRRAQRLPRLSPIRRLAPAATSAPPSKR